MNLGCLSAKFQVYAEFKVNLERSDHEVVAAHSGPRLDCNETSPTFQRAIDQEMIEQWTMCRIGKKSRRKLGRIYGLQP